MTAAEPDLPGICRVVCFGLNVNGHNDFPIQNVATGHLAGSLGHFRALAALQPSSLPSFHNGDRCSLTKENSQADLD